VCVERGGGAHMRLGGGGASVVCVGQRDLQCLLWWCFLDVPPHEIRSYVGR
jgi:hypothetical protein